MKQLFLILCLVSFGITKETKYFGLLLGNSEGVRGETPLQYTRNDVLRLKKALTDGSFFTEKTTRALLEESPLEVFATLGEIRLEIQKAKKENLHTVLFFYYSGHGSENHLHLNNQQLKIEELKGFLANVGADLQLVVLDACESGSMFRKKGFVQNPNPEISWSKKQSAEGMVMIASSGNGQFSVESSEYESAIFSHHLTQGLKGAADFDQNKIISLMEAYQYAKRATERENLTSKEILQNPGYDFNVVGQKSIPLVDLQSGKSKVVLKGFEYGEVGFFNVKTQEREAHLLAMYFGDKELALSAGSYIAILEKGKEKYVNEFRLSENSKQILLQKDFTQIPYHETIQKGGLKGLIPNDDFVFTLGQENSFGIQKYGGAISWRNNFFPRQYFLSLGFFESAEKFSGFKVQYRKLGLVPGGVQNIWCSRNWNWSIGGELALNYLQMIIDDTRSLIKKKNTQSRWTYGLSPGLNSFLEFDLANFIQIGVKTSVFLDLYKEDGRWQTGIGNSAGFLFIKHY